jgi:hypothetical protein
LVLVEPFGGAVGVELFEGLAGGAVDDGGGAGGGALVEEEGEAAGLGPGELVADGVGVLAGAKAVRVVAVGAAGEE